MLLSDHDRIGRLVYLAIDNREVTNPRLGDLDDAQVRVCRRVEVAICGIRYRDTKPRIHRPAIYGESRVAVIRAMEDVVGLDVGLNDRRPSVVPISVDR